MEKVAGYLSSDGKFFTYLKDAELHEATIALEKRVIILGFDPSKLFNVLDELLEEVSRYVTAKQEAISPDGPDSEASTVSDIDQRAGDDGLTEADIAPLLTFEADGHGDVSDIRSGEQSEEVPDKRKGHGSRSRRNNA